MLNQALSIFPRKGSVGSKGQPEGKEKLWLEPLGRISSLEALCEAGAKTETHRLPVAEAGTECWPEGLVFPLWSLMAPSACEQRHDGVKEMFLEGQPGGQCVLFKEGDATSPSLEE